MLRVSFLQNLESNELKVELKAKDAALLTEKATYNKAESERQGLLIELARVQKNVADNSQESAAAQKEIDSMNNAIVLASQVCAGLNLRFGLERLKFCLPREQ